MNVNEMLEMRARQHGEATFRLALSRAVGMPMGTSDQVLLDEARIAVVKMTTTEEGR